MRVPWLSAFILTCALTPAVSQECDEIDRLIATTPSPPTLHYSWSIHLKQMRRIGGTVDIAMIGDSLVEQWPRDAWSGIATANLGVSGDRTQQTLWRLEAPEMARLRPKQVLILLGTNNLGDNAKPCAIVAGLSKVADRVRALWPGAAITFLEVPPRAEHDAARQALNVGMRQLGRTINIDRPLACENGSCETYLADRLHISAKGYAAITPLVRSTLAP